MLTLASVVAIFHGFIVMPGLLIPPFVLLYSVLAHRRYIWLENTFLVLGGLTLLSFIVTGGCVLTTLQQKLLGPTAYQDGFVRHELSYIHINIPDIATTITLFVVGALGVIAIAIQRSRSKKQG